MIIVYITYLYSLFSLIKIYYSHVLWLVSSTDTVITLQYSMWCYRWCSYTCTVSYSSASPTPSPLSSSSPQPSPSQGIWGGGGGYIKMPILFCSVLSIAVLYSLAPLIFIDHSMWHSCSIQCSIESLAAFDGWNVLTLSHFREWMIGASEYRTAMDKTEQKRMGILM